MWRARIPERCISTEENGERDCTGHDLVAGVAVATVTGAWLLLIPKGTRRHRTSGWVSVLALLVTALSSFGIYELRPGLPSVFHIVSVVIVGVIAAGLLAIRRSRNLRLHLTPMTTSLLMMVVTGTAQFFDQLPFSSEAWNAIVFLQVPSIVGFALIWPAAGAADRRPPARPSHS